jgi:F0F1-type ATP synthase assembly protein I
MRAALLLILASSSAAEAAVDSYRYAHVTIATPWYIFLFLMLGVFAPFILMAVLAWRVAMRKSDQNSNNDADQKSSKK